MSCNGTFSISPSSYEGACVSNEKCEKTSTGRFESPFQISVCRFFSFSCRPLLQLKRYDTHSSLLVVTSHYLPKTRSMEIRCALNLVTSQSTSPSVQKGQLNLEIFFPRIGQTVIVHVFRPSRLSTVNDPKRNKKEPMGKECGAWIDRYTYELLSHSPDGIDKIANKSWHF